MELSLLRTERQSLPLSFIFSPSWEMKGKFNSTNAWFCLVPILTNEKGCNTKLLVPLLFRNQHSLTQTQSFNRPFSLLDILVCTWEASSFSSSLELGGGLLRPCWLSFLKSFIVKQKTDRMQIPWKPPEGKKDTWKIRIKSNLRTEDRKDENPRDASLGWQPFLSPLKRLYGSFNDL